MTIRYQYVSLAGVEKDPLEMARRADTNFKQLFLGKMNVAGTFSLTSSSATTVITFDTGIVSDNSVMILTPTNLNAAAELASGAMYRSGRSSANKTITWTHNNNALSRTFEFILLG